MTTSPRRRYHPTRQIVAVVFAIGLSSVAAAGGQHKPEFLVSGVVIDETGAVLGRGQRRGCRSAPKRSGQRHGEPAESHRFSPPARPEMVVIVSAATTSVLIVNVLVVEPTGTVIDPGVQRAQQERHATGGDADFSCRRHTCRRGELNEGLWIAVRRRGDSRPQTYRRSRSMPGGVGSHEWSLG